MDYEQINKNSLKIIEILKEGRAYFNEIYEKTKIKSKNNLLKNLNLLTTSKILTKEENKSNTFYSINYSNNLTIAVLNLINKNKFEKLPFEIKKSISECSLIIKPRIAILFGSYAKGNYTNKSDIDLLFFDTLKEQKEKIKDISKTYGVKLNITLMNLKELNLKSESLMHIFKTGYPLIGEEYFYDELKREI
jgi:predicted nucleotidyltransferase